MAKLFEERVPEYIRELNPYVPGRPIEEVERDLKVRAIKLASNRSSLMSDGTPIVFVVDDDVSVRE
jgi:hypothetical protein